MNAQSIDLDGLVRLVADTATNRVIIGLAGAPGSGKSTIAEALEAALNAESLDKLPSFRWMGFTMMTCC